MSRIGAAVAFAVLGFVASVCAVLLVRLGQAPYKQRDEARDALQNAFIERRQLTEPGVRTERMRQLQSGETAPRDEREFAKVVNDWCALLTRMLRKHRCPRVGEPGHPPHSKDADAAMTEYYADISQRGVRILDQGIELGFATVGTRAKLYAPRSPDDLWKLQDEIWDEHVGPWEKAVNR